MIEDEQDGVERIVRRDMDLRKEGVSEGKMKDEE